MNPASPQFLRRLALALVAFHCSATLQPPPRAETGDRPARAAPSWSVHSSVGEFFPNLELSSRVEYAPGKLTLFADFDRAGEEGVPLYLVNATRQDVELSTQDGDAYIKLEFRDEGGQWQRAQAHQYSFCVNSYVPITLKAGQHARFFGYMPRAGRPATARFRRSVSPELVSNAGGGFYDERDLRAARADEMAMAVVPRSLRDALRSPRNDAEPAVDPQQWLLGLQLLSVYVESDAHRRAAEQLAVTFSEGDPIRRSLEKALAREWPREPDAYGLLAFCLEKLETRATAADERELVWRTIADLLSGDQLDLEDARTWALAARAYALLPAALEEVDSQRASAPAALLLEGAFANRYLGDALLFDWLRSGASPVSMYSARLLASRAEYEALAKTAMSLSPELQIMVLREVAFEGDAANWPRRPRRVWRGDELGFWLHCIETQPIAAVETLDAPLGLGGRGWNPYGLSMRQPLVDFLWSEIERLDSSADLEDARARGIARVARFVGSWGRKDDVPLFRALLNHPILGRDPMRKAAMEAFLGLGELKPDLGAVEK